MNINLHNKSTQTIPLTLTLKIKRIINTSAFIIQVRIHIKHIKSFIESILT